MFCDTLLLSMKSTPLNEKASTFDFTDLTLKIALSFKPSYSPIFKNFLPSKRDTPFSVANQIYPL